jgi:hypothetical protein
MNDFVRGLDAGFVTMLGTVADDEGACATFAGTGLLRANLKDTDNEI